MRFAGLAAWLVVAATSSAADSSAGPPSAGTAPAVAPADVLRGVRRVLVLGDSITYAGQYVDIVEAEALLADPASRIELINVGLPSETVSGLSEAGHAGGKFPRPDLHERLDRILAKWKGELVIACYGMNDGIYLPLSPERARAFQDGMKKLHEKATAGGAKVLHLTPPPFDPVPIQARVAPADKADAGHPFQGYDEVLQSYGQWLLDRRADGWLVADVGGAVRSAVSEKRKQDPMFTFSRDGIHPNDAGHAVMADAVLTALGLRVNPGDRFGDPSDPKSVRAQVRKLVHDRGRVRKHAWLRATGHQRPGIAAGLPMEQAEAMDAELTAKIEALRTGIGQNN
jgi:lysophospholipase L1-like esterase